MIQQDAFELASTIAAIAAENGKTLIPQPGTPLELLARHSFVALTDVVSGATNCMEMENQSNNSLHNQQFDELVKMASEAVAGHRFFARNVVVPAVATIAEAVSSAMAQLDPNPASQFKIVRIEAPAPLSDDGLYQSMSKEVRKSDFVPTGGFSFGAKSAEEVITAMLTGSAKTDALIRTWTSSVGDAWLVNLWENLFRKPTEANPVKVIDFRGYVYGVGPGLLDAINGALGIYLISRKLTDDIAEGSGLPLMAYRSKVVEFREAAATRLLSLLNNIDTNGKNGVVIEFWSTLEKTVYVNPVGYKAYLFEGGTNEALFGALAGNTDRPTILGKLMEQQATLRKAWSFYQITSQTRFRNDAFRFFKENLRAALFSDLRNATEAETTYHKANTSFVTNMSAALDREIDALNPGDIEDIPRTVTRVVAKARFFYTDAYKFLVTMDDIMRKDPSIDAASAADMATAEAVADYLIDMIKVSTL